MTTRPTTRRKTVAAVAMLLVTFSLGVAGAVFVAHPASASSPVPTTSSASSPATTTSSTCTTTTTPTTTSTFGVDPNSPAAHFFVFNGTVNAASDHEILGSSAFPNYTTGAVDNYYSMAKSHVDNSPFAEGTASPFDTGPAGQTAAAGNTQQPQYADARQPGDTCHATYGSQGGPYAVADAGDYNATAGASEGSNEFAVPEGFDSRLRVALAAWKAKWLGPVGGESKAPAVTIPAATIPTPTATVTTPTATIPTPTATPPLQVPPAAVPSAPATPDATVLSRTLSASPSASGASESLLESSTLSILDPKLGALVTSGESSLGRVSIGDGQIVLKGIHVSAKITNDGATSTPPYTTDVTVGAASIAGVPVTIDQDGVHLVTQHQSLPYQQAGDALNNALKQAGIQLFIVTPEVTSCGQTGGTGTGTTTTTTTTTTTSSDQSGMENPNSCDQTGTTTTCGQTGTGTGTTTTTTTTSSDQSGMENPNSCDQTGMTTTCGQTGTGTGTGTTATTTTTPALTPSSTTTTTTTMSSDQPGTGATPNSCAGTGMTPTTSSCGQTSTGTGATTTPSDPMGMAPGTGNSGEETVTATGVHVVFTQPVGQSGVPAQFAEHILGEVFVDSLAVPAGPPPKLDLSSPSSSLSPACGGHKSRTTKSGGRASAAGGSSSTGGLSSPAGASNSSGSGSLPSSASTFGSTSQPTGSSTGTSLPASIVSALRKPLWLLLAYLLWQVLVIGTGASLWNWRREEAP